jgi:hypothetical protein
MFCTGKNSIVLTVLTIYAPLDGKNICHGWTVLNTDISAISYIVVQTYEPSFHGFHALHGARLPLATFSFAHLSSDAILDSIPDEQWIIAPGGMHTELNLPAQEVFKELLHSLEDVVAATRDLSRRRWKEKQERSLQCIHFCY